MQASAAENDNSLVDCELGISCGSDGIILSADAFTTSYADEIGCRDVVLTETYNGVTTHINIPGTSGSGYDFVASGTYREAIKGATYSASCTFYARWGNTEDTISVSTDSLVYN